jgi:acyl-coenzyme A thioesterase PaaI-like protein
MLRDRHREETSYDRLRRRQHRNCIVCGRAQGLEFYCRDGEVIAEIECRRFFEGYAGMVHGGVICAVLDGAMTNCLFAAGRAAVTGDLHVRFRKPVAARGTATVRAWIEESLPPLHRVAAELQQDGEVKATARARFMESPGAAVGAGRSEIP